MSYFENSSLGDVTRGGQVLLHFLRMIWQVTQKFAGAMLVTTLLVAGSILWSKTSRDERQLCVQYALAWVDVRMLRNPNRPRTVQREGHAPVTVRAADLAAGQGMQVLWAQLRHKAITSALTASVFTGMFFCVIVVWVWRSGSAQRLEQHIRGARIVDQLALRALLRHMGRASDLQIAHVPIVKGSETSHMLITGSPGTGKSTAIYELMARIRARGDRCICFSPSGDFIQWFYREGPDRILNPFDARCPAWNLWEECPEPFHHDMIAAAIIPDPARLPDPFWNNAARTVLASLTQTMGARGEHTVSRLLELLAQVDLDMLHDYLRGSEGATLIDPGSERTAVSIRTTAATFVRALRYLPVAGEPFHIRRWVHDERQNGWMFLNAQRDQIDSVRSILSAWLEVFANALTSLPPSRTRRIWLIIDELHSLNRIPSLAPFLAESRKYGGCGVIAFHQVAQLRERYGRDGAEALTGACATWVCMRQNDPETAKWIANSFGQVEVYEAHQGLTYGANDMRDGVSLSRMRKQRPVLLDSEISQLDNLEGYIRLPGPFPMGRFRQRWRAPKIVADAFVPAQRSTTGDAALFPDVSATDLPPLDTAELQPAGLFDEPAPTRVPAEPTSAISEEV